MQNGLECIFFFSLGKVLFEKHFVAVATILRSRAIKTFIKSGNFFILQQGIKIVVDWISIKDFIQTRIELSV